jgi:biopolymer transport protein TolR
MSAAVQGKTGGGGRRGRRKRSAYVPMSEINVTPFVDVMLVLLIVFMVTAPLLSVGVPVDLPKTQAATLSDTDEPLVVSIDAKGIVYLQKQEISLEQLIPRLQAVTGAKPDTRIFVRGDQAIQYGTVMQVMGHISAAGFKKVSLMAELPKDAPKSKK